MNNNKKYEKQKPIQITGVIESIEKSELKKTEYLGNSDYFVVILKLKENDNKYEYNVPEKESFDFKIGEEIFFRSLSFDGKNKIAFKSLGKKINPEHYAELGSALIDELRLRNECSVKKSNKIKPQ